MGNLCCGSDMAHVGPAGSQQNRSNTEIPVGSTKPLSKTVDYTTKEPWTAEELRRKREAFWDTAPKFDGRAEIWQALKAVCESEDLTLAQAICDSAGIILPTGLMSDGVFDELGNRYVIPQYCFVQPKNMILCHVGDRYVEKGVRTNDAETPESSTPSLSIILRLSTNKDVKMSVPANDSVADLKSSLLKLETELEGKRLRFIHLGKSLEDSQKIIQFANTPDIVIQVMVTG